jgi:hypothetical protein
MADSLPATMRAWVERELAIEGIFAAGGGNLGGNVFSAFAHGDLALALGEEVWRCLMEALDNLRTHGGATREMLWGFESGILCTLRRDDGLWLGVFTGPRLSDESALALRAKLDAFKVEPFGEAKA